MPPEDRFVPCFAAEPPQDLLPYGRWAQTLGEEFLAACLAIDGEGEELGEPGEVAWYPDRTWHGRTFVPATALTSTGLGAVRLRLLRAAAETARSRPTSTRSPTSPRRRPRPNPDWQIDLCDEVIGTLARRAGQGRGDDAGVGRPLVDGGAVATGELADLTVDQCPLVEGRFTLIAPDDYRGDTLDVKLYDRRGGELARESLYAEDDDEDEEDE